MNRQELVNAVAKKLNVTKRDTDRVLEALLEEIKSEVIAGREVRIRDFATFQGCRKKAKVSRNPRTGETFQVPGYWGVKVIVADTLKETIRNSGSVSGTQMEA